MAEVVQLRLERSILDYEQMRTLKIFEEDEIRDIIKQREHYEYQLVQHTKILKYYLDYIRYECGLVAIIVEKKHKTLENNLESSILRRIRNLYEQATIRFANDEQLWDQYFIFMVKSAADNSDVSSVLENMLQFHGNKPSAWLKFIKWERYLNKNLQNAKNLLLRGTQRHSDCIEMYVELLNIIWTNELNVPDEQILSTSNAVYKNCKTLNSKNLHAFIAILDEISKYPNSMDLQAEILEDIKSFDGLELYWETVAQRQLKSKKHPTKEQIQNCIDRYDEAVKRLNTTEMWSYYLNAVLALNINVSSYPNMKRRLLGKTLKAADESNVMSEQHYLQYIDILYATKTDEDVVVKIIQKSIDVHPKSSKLWTKLIQFYIDADDLARVNELFNKFKKPNISDSHLLWELYYSFAKTTPNCNKIVEKFFEQVLNEVNVSFHHLKAEYIEWSALSGGIKKARQVYQKICKNSRPCLAVHKKMAEIESKQLKPDIRHWRNCLELAASFYGKDDIQVWIDYLNFELTAGDPKIVGKITERAINQLQPEFRNSFVAQKEHHLSGVLVS